ncbi:unnamed protein product [Orchesella dallaii]|uniref:C-type lectin domain-containing protein n=1 Tax=Orchesella dallaii TaxID=48710 RepID=A0ABP1QBJ1_9HEXA
MIFSSHFWQMVSILVLAFTVANTKRLRRSFDECSLSQEENEENKPVSLGNVDGKIYYAEKTRRTWHSTRVYCKDLGMELATITSQEQANFLKLAYDANTFSDQFWLGGRDSFQPRQFSWDKSGEAVTTLNKFLWFKEDDFSYQTCLVYESEKMPNILMYDCEFNGMQALCEEM